MTTTGPNDPQAPAPESKVAPDTLELRTPPRPVTRINRKVLIGAAAVVLLLIAGLVLVALRAPSLRVAGPKELFNVEHKPITDALSKLPATYDGVQPDKKLARAKETAPGPPKGGPHLTGQAGRCRSTRPTAPRRRASPACRPRPARSQVFFRLQLKAPPKETAATELRPDALLRPPPTTAISDGGLTALTTLRAAERALALAGGDVDALGASTSDQSRKLTFLKAGPEKEIYNPHPCRRRPRPTS